ncbi:STAS domain-containing protein [Kitasatospora sp. NBC_00070]|uniref:STAS domain-containing protein n=1 Tax=Kitasatospora sp. NBC_00070 TaxID=2975962 RepID=UPI0032443007
MTSSSPFRDPRFRFRPDAADLRVPADSAGSGGPVHDSGPQLDVRVTSVGGGRYRARVAGDVDLDSARQLEWALAAALHTSETELAVDLAAVTFADCAALNTLLRLHTLARETGRTFVLDAPSAQVERLLQLTGTRGTFTVRSSPTGTERGEPVADEQ